jgi:nucleoside-diphosphate-sugar epimerase
MRVFLTGATGFIGSEVARRLLERGDDVRVLVRSPEKAAWLADLGCQIVPGDVSDYDSMCADLFGADAAIHVAAIYEIGVPKSRHQEMWATNVKGAENLFRAAMAAGVPKIVYVSTIAAFGNTRGQTVDETYEHPGDSYTSVYEQTKVEAHRLAVRLAAERDAPIVIVQPGVVYGHGDHSDTGTMIDKLLDGKLPALPFPDLGIVAVHRDDVADGIILALDKGVAGESYVLGGEITRMRDFLNTLAEVAGKRAPKRAVPTGLIKLSAPLGRVIGPAMGFGPNLKEMISSAHGVTFWAKDDKARRELGYSPRPLEQGFKDLLAAREQTASS